MKAYAQMSVQERQEEYRSLQREFEDLKARGLKLNMARGKPGKEQLDLVSDIFGLMQKPEDYVSDGVDVRNYGELCGLPAARELFADILARAGVRRRQRQLAADVRYHCQGLYPRPAAQRAPLVQGAGGEVAVPRPRL